jgi:hypothetical protein
MEHNMAAKEVETKPSTEHQDFYDLSNRVSRSMVAVIDTITQRGGFKGEELSTIGGLRDQCIQIIQSAEAFQQAMAEE